MYRKVHVLLMLDVVMFVDEGTEVSKVIEEAELTMTDTTGNATILDISIEKTEITDSK
jgi:hypothetical protein